jgi:hypothetical protein
MIASPKPISHSAEKTQCGRHAGDLGANSEKDRRIALVVSRYGVNIMDYEPQNGYVPMIAKYICAWCNNDLGDRDVDVPEGMAIEPVTHGICDGCVAALSGGPAEASPKMSH